MAGGEFGFTSMPLIEVSLPIANWIFLVDSGADYCYLPASVGEALNINIKSVQPRKSQGITSTPFLSYFHDVDCKIGGWYHKMEIGFSYDLNGLPFGILGREEFFSLFKVCVDHKKEEIELKSYI